MTAADVELLAKLLDGGGTLALAVVVIVVLLRASRFVERVASNLAVLVERTRGLRVVPHKKDRGVTVTLDPPVGEDEDR